MTHFTSRILIFFILVLTSGLGMSKGEKLPADEFARRRAIFVDELRELNACAILHAAPIVERNHDIEYPYRQDSDFLYLTGWDYAEAILFITPQSVDTSKAEIHLFVSPKDAKREIWTGPKPGPGDARMLPGVDLASSYDDFFDYFNKLIGDYERIVISYGNHVEFKEQFNTELNRLHSHPPILQEASSLIKNYRLIKSESEILAIETAIQITNSSFQATLPRIPSLNFEYEVQAEIEYGFTRQGSHRLGFPSIIGAGKHATYLHYEDNHGSLNHGDLLLMDIGTEWDYYSADISRTVPISGKFTKEQTLLYELVLKAQLQAIDAVQPGAKFQDPHNIAVQVITEGLIDLGILNEDPDQAVRQKSYKKYFMHGTSHWLGLDVHDVGGRTMDNGTPLLLKPGMVLTVEPGIYISEADDVDSRWWNIGIRIEDDVLVTKQGHRVLSASIPKTITEIETLMQP